MLKDSKQDSGRAWSPGSRPRLSLDTSCLLKSGEELKRKQGFGLEGDLIPAFEKLPFYLEKLDAFTKLSDNSRENYRNLEESKTPMGTEREG